MRQILLSSWYFPPDWRGNKYLVKFRLHFWGTYSPKPSETYSSMKPLYRQVNFLFIHKYNDWISLFKRKIRNLPFGVVVVIKETYFHKNLYSTGKTLLFIISSNWQNLEKISSMSANGNNPTELFGIDSDGRGPWSDQEILLPSKIGIWYYYFWFS